MSRERQSKDKSKHAHIELRFSLTFGDNTPTPFVLRGTSSRVTIGRSPISDFVISKRCVSYEHCVLFLKRKGRDAQLCIKDRSKNLTGVRHIKPKPGDCQWKELRHDGMEVLHHRSQLLVPLLGGRSSSEAGTKEDRRTVVTVLFSLPDSHCCLRKTGRWLYGEKLGEGGLAVVYRATDMEKGLGDVAVKVSKFSNLPAVSQQNRHVYALHREALWSIERLHNADDARYQPAGAALFARYLEDHTGFGVQTSLSFDDLRNRFEDPDFAWGNHEFSPSLEPQPYVVMELIDGKLLQLLIDSAPPLDTEEKREIVRQCAESLVYMERFNAIHRDFRGCNIFLQGRGSACQVKVIDLGFMISLGPLQANNTNAAVRCAWQGDPARKLRFDWAPPEVRAKGSPNYAPPGCSFDVYSFGVLVLKLLRGRAWAQETLDSQALWRIQEVKDEVEALGLSPELLLRALDSPERRPSPRDLLEALGPPAGSRDRALPRLPVAAAAPGPAAEEEQRRLAPQRAAALAQDGGGGAAAGGRCGGGPGASASRSRSRSRRGAAARRGSTGGFGEGSAVGVGTSPGPSCVAMYEEVQ